MKNDVSNLSEVLVIRSVSVKYLLSVSYQKWLWSPYHVVDTGTEALGAHTNWPQLIKYYLGLNPSAVHLTLTTLNARRLDSLLSLGQTLREEQLHWPKGHKGLIPRTTLETQGLEGPGTGTRI